MMEVATVETATLNGYKYCASECNFIGDANGPGEPCPICHGPTLYCWTYPMDIEIVKNDLYDAMVLMSQRSLTKGDA